MVRNSYGKEKIHRYEQWRNPDVEEGGIIRISGKFLLDHETEIINLIKHEDKLAQERNPNHKVTKIEKEDDMLIVETSVHNLAERIGHALKRAYKGEFELKFRPGEKFVEIDWRREN